MHVSVWSICSEVVLAMNIIMYGGVGYWLCCSPLGCEMSILIRCDILWEKFVVSWAHDTHINLLGIYCGWNSVGRHSRANRRFTFISIFIWILVGLSSAFYSICISTIFVLPIKCRPVNNSNGPAER